MSNTRNDISERTPNVESKIIMVVFGQFIRRYLVCDPGILLCYISSQNF